MSDETQTPKETWIQRLKVVILALTAFAIAYHVRDLIDGTEKPLWWLHLAWLLVIAGLTWLEHPWALFSFVLYIVAYNYLWVLAESDRPLAQGVVVGGIVVACALKYLYERRRKKRAA